MKKTNSIAAMLLCLTLLLTAACCAAAEAVATLPELWETALYTEDAEFGTGAVTVTVEVTAADMTVAFTLHTDAETVGAALFENGLIEGEDGPYGLYVKVVNGITADYDIDQSYWSFYINGGYAMSGVDTTEITEGNVYQLVYTK